MKHPIVWVVAVAVVVAGGLGIAWWAMSREDASSATWLFSHTADGGSLVENGDGVYTLTLSGIDEDVVAFTDHPERNAAVLTPDALPEYWSRWFPGSDPNGVVVQHGAAGEGSSTVLTLANPRITGEAPGRSLTFDATLVTAEIPDSLRRLAGEPTATPPSEFDGVSLFIDGASTVTVIKGKGGTSISVGPYSLTNAISTPYCPPACGP